MTDGVILGSAKITAGGQISVLKLKPYLRCAPGDRVQFRLQDGRVILEKP